MRLRSTGSPCAGREPVPTALWTGRDEHQLDGPLSLCHLRTEVGRGRQTRGVRYVYINSAPSHSMLHNDSLCLATSFRFPNCGLAHRAVGIGPKLRWVWRRVGTARGWRGRKTIDRGGMQLGRSVAVILTGQSAPNIGPVTDIRQGKWSRSLPDGA